jgi:hypothetical protein
MFAQLVGQANSVVDEVFAGPARASQRQRGVAVRDQRAQPGPVGAQCVGENEGVESVVFVAGRAVASAQVLDLVRADDHHCDAGLEQRLDDRSIGAFDRDFRGPGADEFDEQPTQTRRGVLNGEPVRFTASTVDDRHCVVVAGPVQASGHTAFRLVGQLGDHGIAGRLHVSLLAARPSGEAPSCGAGAWLPVRSLIGAQRRSALSTVGTPRASAGPRRTHAGHRTCQASRAMTRRHLGCITDRFKISDTRMVHQ